MIDHIHFQYNGFLYGILIFSLVLARKQQTLLPSALLFAALLCLKHIYLYLAPAYCVFLLRVYCLSPRSFVRLRIWNILKLGTGLLTVFGASFGPFIYLGQTEQLLSQLFPFSRGLCHAYWAPNFWAMYAFTDRLLIYGTVYPLGQRNGISAKFEQWPPDLAWLWIPPRSTARLEDSLAPHHSRCYLM